MSSASVDKRWPAGKLKATGLRSVPGIPKPWERWKPCPLAERCEEVDCKRHWLWRAIDANGDVLVQTRRNAKAAKRFFQRLVARFGEPRVITDKLRSYIKPIKTLAPGADHRAHKGLNNAIEASHRPTRKREKIFGRFKSHRQTQRFLSAHDQINLIFRPRRYQITAISYRHARSDAFSLWADYTATRHRIKFPIALYHSSKTRITPMPTRSCLHKML